MFKLEKEIFGAQAWQAAILLCISVVQLAAARYIGPAGIGVTAMMVSSYSFCFLFIELNLQSALVRKISLFEQDKERISFKEKILNARISLALGIAPVVAATVALAAHGYRSTIFFGIIGGVVAQELNPSWWLHGVGQSGNYFRLAGYCALTAAFTVFPLVYLIRQPGIENLLMSLVGVFFYGAYWWRHKVLFSVGRLKDSIVFYASFACQHKSFLLGGAGVYLNLYPAQLLLASTRSIEEAGVYRVAMMPGVAYYALAAAAFNAYYPRVVWAHSNGEFEYQLILRRVFLIIFGVGVVAWLTTLGFKNLFGLVVGHGFELSVALAPALMISKAIGGAGLVVRAALLAKEKEHAVFSLYFVVGVITLILNGVIIPRYGVIGAAVIEITMETTHLVILLSMLVACTKHED